MGTPAKRQKLSQYPFMTAALAPLKSWRMPPWFLQKQRSQRRRAGRWRQTRRPQAAAQEAGPGGGGGKSTLWCCSVRFSGGYAVKDPKDLTHENMTILYPAS